MTTATLSPTIDGSIRSDSGTYSTARNSYNAGVVAVSFGTLLGAQRLNSGTYNYFECFTRFDPSSIPADAMVEDVRFKVKTSSGTGDNIDIVLLGYDCGTGITSADFRTPTDLSGYTEYGRLVGQTISPDTEYTITLNASGRAALQTAVSTPAAFGFMWVSASQLAGTAPTGDDRFTVYSQDTTTAADRPVLQVDYNTGFAVGVSALTIAGLAPSLAIDTVVDVAASGLTIAAPAPTVSIEGGVTDTEIAVGVSALTVAGLTPDLAVDAAVSPDAVSLTVAGLAPSVLPDVAISPDVAALTVTAPVPEMQIDVDLGVGVAGVTVEALVPTVAIDRLVDVGSVSLALQVNAPTLQVDLAVNVAASSLTLTLPVPALRVDQYVPVPAGEMTLTVLDPTRVGPLWRPGSIQAGAWSEAATQSATWSPENTQSASWTDVPVEN